jgi:hypothetical protein
MSCTACGGRGGVVDGDVREVPWLWLRAYHPVQVTIPAGVRDSARFRLPSLNDITVQHASSCTSSPQPVAVLSAPPERHVDYSALATLGCFWPCWFGVSMLLAAGALTGPAPVADPRRFCDRLTAAIFVLVGVLPPRLAGACLGGRARNGAEPWDACRAGPRGRQSACPAFGTAFVSRLGA